MRADKITQVAQSAEFFAHRFDPETKHTLLQYAAAMIDRILSMAGNPPPRFATIEIPPHPVHKVQHLRPWFGDRVIEAESRGITVLIEDRVMDRACWRRPTAPAIAHLKPNCIGRVAKCCSSATPSTRRLQKTPS